MCPPAFDCFFAKKMCHMKQNKINRAVRMELQFPRGRPDSFVVLLSVKHDCAAVIPAR